MQGYIRMATDGANMGWRRRNGGNLTYRLTAEEAEAAAPYMTFDKPWEDIGVAVPNLGGAFFLATGSGKFMRNVCLAPQDNLSVASSTRPEPSTASSGDWSRAAAPPPSSPRT